MAVRVIRPYSSEDEYLAKEGDSITKTTIELLGAHSRPTGIILRFEVTLQSGKTLIRGEGRVTQFNERGRDGQPSLSLRFTKLDPKSKALVDRAVQMRQPQGLPGAHHAATNALPGSGELPPAAPSSEGAEIAEAAEAGTPTPPPPARNDTEAPPTPLVATPSAQDPGDDRNDTTPPPTPLVRRDTETLARISVTLPDDPDPEGEAVTAAPPPATSNTDVAPARSPGTIPPPTNRPSVLPPIVRAELRRMSDAPPPLPSQLPPDPSPLASQLPSQLPSQPPSQPPQPASLADASVADPPAPPSARREALLTRLRDRAKALPIERIAEITKPRSGVVGST